MGTATGPGELAKFLTTNFVAPSILPHRRRLVLQQMETSLPLASRHRSWRPISRGEVGGLVSPTTAEY